MSDTQRILEDFKAIIPWVNQLVELDDAAWFKPIAEGKASIAEIISHLENWDRYLITKAIPSAQKGEGIVFPDFDPFNTAAYEYARSGISKSQLVGKFCATRMELYDLLLEIGEEALRKHVAANGVALCPHTGTPYSVLYIIQEFIEHDLHHKKQIDHALLR
ncbi:DinB family protein [Paenibacillus oryzisoli]|uniref:DinB family protein n=1 Tax=Paenibacillus oryzisoli TaxID=1850517 RepID=UPI003D2C574D